MAHLGQVIDAALGLHRQAQDLSLAHILLRAIIIFFAVLVMLRLAEKRFLAQRNTLDTLLGLVLGSMLARAINGSERFFETIAAGFSLVILHRILAWACCRYHVIGLYCKGRPQILVENGKIKDEVLLRHHVSKHDLEEDLRLKTGSDEIQRIQKAQLERNGEISVKEKKT
jgi:uncharacterized membrane protein YcaP (DUF421 family)